MCGFRQRISQPHEQVFFFIHDLVGNLDLQKQSRRIDLVRRARLFVLARLDEISAIARTIESHFPLFAATLRANAPVNGGAKAFLLANFTNSATQWVGSPVMHYGTFTRASTTDEADFGLQTVDIGSRGRPAP